VRVWPERVSYAQGKYSVQKCQTGRFSLHVQHGTLPLSDSWKEKTMSLNGKTAVITGSNSGIGLGVAWELARAGANVVLNSFTYREEDHAIAAGIAEEAGVSAR